MNSISCLGTTLALSAYKTLSMLICWGGRWSWTW